MPSAGKISMVMLHRLDERIIQFVRDTRVELHPFDVPKVLKVARDACHKYGSDDAAIFKKVLDFATELKHNHRTPVEFFK